MGSRDLYRPLGALVCSLALVVGCACAGDGRLEPESVPTLTPRPDLTIGSLDDPDASFGRVEILVALPDGGVLVGDLQCPCVREYDATGASVRQYGTRGQGPGQFTTVEEVGLFRDRIWIMDSGQRRVVWFGLDGTHVDTRRLHFAEQAGAPRVSTPRGVLGDSLFVARTWVGYPFRGDRPPAYLPLLTLDATGATRDTLAWLREEHHVLVIRGPGEASGSLMSRQPFRYQSVWTTLPNGEGIRLAEHVSSGVGDSIRIVTLGPRGDTVAHWTVPIAGLPLTDERFEAFVEHHAESVLRSPSLGVRSPTEAQRLVRQALFRPLHLPSVTGILAADDEAYLLQREPAGPGEPQRWTYFRGPFPVADVLVPPRTTVMAARGTTLWGVYQDEFDVQYVVRLPLALGG